jgi:hypothetical protein
MPTAQTLRAAEEILAVSGEQGLTLWLGVGDIMRGWYLGALGQPAEATLQRALSGSYLRQQRDCSYRASIEALGEPAVDRRQ